MTKTREKMGIQGFAKYINDRAHLYLENYELRDCTLIIDGHSISCQLYNWKHWQFDARSYNSYGGDYDKYAYIVENFFGMLKEVKIKPVVVFDGGFEQRKLPTILSRMQDKINIADKLDPDYEVKWPNRIVFPLFLREAFKDILMNMDIQMVMCEYEGDTEIASLAKALNCPVLTFDSDYFLFGAQYIPFKTLDSKVSAIENWRTGTYKCISCKMFKIEKFLSSFRGLQENTFHLVPVLLGNDYINCKMFNRFLVSIKANVSIEDRIQLILEWLKNETPEIAIKKILSSFKGIKEKLFILNRMEKIVTGYYFVEGKVFKYLNIKGHTNRTYKEIDFNSLREIVSNSMRNGTSSPECAGKNVEHPISPKEEAREIKHSDERKPTNELSTEGSLTEESCTNNNTNREEESHEAKDLENGEISSEIQSDKIESQTPDLSDEEMPLCDTLSFEETHLEKEDRSENPICKVFEKNFTKCQYPSSFMDIITHNKYYCIPQIENHCEESSHKFSFDILRAIHKMLTNSDGANFTIVGRGDGTKVEWFPQEQYTVPVPSLDEIEQLTLQGRREIFFRILNIDDSFVSLLEHFPTEWHTFLVALKFAASKTNLETPLIYSLLLSFIILNYIDQRIGYYRCAKRYQKKYYSYMQNLPVVHEHVPFRADKNCFYYFPSKDCIVFMQKVVHLFTVDPNETSNTFDKHLIHKMAQIQSVLLHIKYLNSLLKYPYPNLVIHQIFDGTLIYNLTRTFKEKSAGLENNYLNVIFKDCPSILAALKYVLNMLNKQIVL